MVAMIRKLPDGRYRIYSRQATAKPGKCRNLGTFAVCCARSTWTVTA